MFKTGYLQSRVELPTRCAEARAHGCIECALDAPDPASGRCLGPGSCARGDYRDVTLMRADVALEYPVETVLSGPAASVVGAAFLSGLNDFAVSDMGGTMTDVAIVIGGRSVVRDEGAVIGGWRTTVQAVEVRTCGLGGDSEVHFDRDSRLTVGPRRARPLSLLAHQFPDVLNELRQLASAERLPPFATQFALPQPQATGLAGAVDYAWQCDSPGRACAS